MVINTSQVIWHLYGILKKEQGWRINYSSPFVHKLQQPNATRFTLQQKSYNWNQLIWADKSSQMRSKRAKNSGSFFFKGVWAKLPVTLAHHQKNQQLTYCCHLPGRKMAYSPSSKRKYWLWYFPDNSVLADPSETVSENREVEIPLCMSNTVSYTCWQK